MKAKIFRTEHGLTVQHVKKHARVHGAGTVILSDATLTDEIVGTFVAEYPEEIAATDLELPGPVLKKMKPLFNRSGRRMADECKILFATHSQILYLPHN